MKVRKSNRQHHCYKLDDLKPLVVQLGFHVSDKSWENEKIAVAMSIEKENWQHGCIVQLDKTTGELVITT